MAFGALRGFWTNTATSVGSSTQTLSSGSAVTGGTVNNVAVGDLIVVVASGQSGGTANFNSTGHSDNLGNTNPTSQPTGGYFELQAQSWNSSARFVQVFACRSGFAGNLTTITLDTNGSTTDDTVFFIAVFEGELNTQSGGVTTGWLRDNDIEQDISSPFDAQSATNSLGDLLVGWGTANHSTTWAAATVGSPNPIASTLIGNVNSGSTVKVAMTYRVQTDEADTGLIGFTAGSNPSAGRVGSLAIIPIPNINIFPAGGNLTLSTVAPTATLSDNRFAVPAQGNLALSSAAPTIQISPAPQPAAANLTLAGQAPTVTIIPPGTFIPAPGSLALSTFVPLVHINIHTIITVGSAQLVISSTMPSLAIRYPSNSVSWTGTATFELIPPFILFAATREFITEPTDDLPDQPFKGTLQKALRFDRTILNGGGIGQVTIGWGELELINAEGDYDDLIEQYAVDGRRVVVRVGVAGPPFVYDDFITVFDGSALDWHIDENVMRVEVRDNTFKLEVPAQPNLYTGTGGVDGPDDLAGKRKPRAWGTLTNITPTSLIPSELVYQVNDGEVVGIDIIYDGGVELTAAVPADYANSTLLRAATTGLFGSGADIEAGEYATCLAEGLFRLGGTPQAQVTCDIRGQLFRNVWVSTHADLIFSLVAPASSGDPGTVPVTVDDNSFALVNSLQSAPIGYFLNEQSEASVADVIADIAASMGGWAGFRGRSGLFEVGIFRDPDVNIPVARYNRTDIMGDSLTREKLPPDYSPPPYRFRVAWGRNWTVQDDLFGSVDASRVAHLKQAMHLAISEPNFETAIRGDHPLAQDPPPVESFFTDEFDAQVEAERLLELYSLAPRALYRFTIKSHPFVHDIGEVINLAYPRWGLDAGRNLRLVSVSENTDDNTTELIGFG